jgi:hypothetical protein
MAAQTLVRDGLGDLTWLETGLREATDQACRTIVEGLLAMEDLRIPEDKPREGERRLNDVPRTLRTLFGDVPVQRTWYKAKSQEGRFPMDRALGLVDGHTPAMASLICRDAAHQPFIQAEDDFKAHTGLNVEARQFQRLALRVGPEVEAFLRADHGPGTEQPPRVYVQVDGTGTPLRHQELKGRRGKGPHGQAHTHEIKVAALFTEHPHPAEEPWRDRDSTTYVATDERCTAFGAMVRAEYRRRFDGQPETIALGDGAAWIWRLFWINFPRAVQIVDFHHAAEHVAALAELVHPRDSRAWKALRRKWTAKLWNGNIDALIASARATIPRSKAKKARKALAYFETNRSRMAYDKFRANGYFIGSGVVEAACKTLVGQRFKGAGMHWSLRGLKCLLSIRTAILSRRYDHFWTWRAATLKPTSNFRPASNLPLVTKLRLAS